MANMSDYLEEKILKALFKNEFYASPTPYIALLTAVPDDTSTGSTISEPSTEDGYARQLADSTKWGDPDDGTIKNSADIKWEDVEWTATIVAVAICDAVEDGNVLFWGELASTKQIAFGDSVTFRPDALSIEIDD